MEKTSAKRWGKLGGAVAASVALHLAVLAVFLVKLPELLPQPQPEETVTVELVPPPEEKKPEEKAKAEEPPTPEEAKAEEAKAEEPPAPAEPPPPPSQGEGQPVPLPVLRPVFEFGEKDRGPKQDTNGDASQEAAKPPPETKPQPEEAKPSETVAEKTVGCRRTDRAVRYRTTSIFHEVTIANTPALRTKEIAGAESSSETSIELSQVKPPSEPATQPAEAAEARPSSDLAEVRTLFSRSVTDDPFAMTAMASLSRSERADQLCLTELREQLRHAGPQYRPVLLPSFTLEQGTVLDIREAAFRTSSQWYELSFRCEVDEDVTKVVSFAFHIGDPIPKSEWERRGFPAF